MRQVQGPWGRLHTTLPVNHSKRAAILEVCLRMTNVRARLVGLNRIQSVYYDSWRVDHFGPSRSEAKTDCRVELLFREKFGVGL